MVSLYDLQLLDGSNEKEFNQISVLAVGIGVGVDNKQRHTGFIILYDGKYSIMHHGWHNHFLHQITKEEIDENFQWFAPVQSMNSDHQEDFVDWLMAHWEANRNNIPYSVVYDPSTPYYNSDSSYKRRNDGEGLTCATFVMESLRSFGWEMFNYDTWKQREKDPSWFQTIFKKLKEHIIEHPRLRITQKHIDAQDANSKQSPRFKPEEVVTGVNVFKDVSCQITMKVAENHACSLLQKAGWPK